MSKFTRARVAFVPALALTVALLVSALRADDTGFRPIFDGKTLLGWSAHDARYWSVEDGAIIARSSDELPCTENQFLVWSQGEIDDFELTLEFKITGHPSANSGVQIRSAIAPDGHASGYQADLDAAGQWRGALYDEHTGRQLLAAPGQRTTISPDGARKSEALGGEEAPYRANDWNAYHITARGSRITIRVNGVVTSDVVDEQIGERDLAGLLAVQLHSGPPCTIRFRNIRLKRLPLSDGRKKIVMIAGAPSHPSGQHEFNAGIKILAKRLRALESPVVVADYHDNGWPNDPTATDNANAIVIYADGQGRHPIMKHFDQVEALMSKGVGLMCMHYAVHVAPGEQGDRFKKWIGGFYETDWSSNPHWTADLEFAEQHPVTRGVKPRGIYDEWYFNMRFRDGEKGVTAIAQAKPDDKARAINNYPRKTYPHIVAASGRVETLMWAVKRPDGGRGIGFTGGHWHRNWALDTQRRLILNACLWVAGAEVPSGGVDSEPVSKVELNANLDKKNPIERIVSPDAEKQ